MDAIADTCRLARHLEGHGVSGEVLEQLVEVEARAERVVAAAEDHRADLSVLLGAVDGDLELGQQLLAHAVALVRSVQPDVGDHAPLLVLNRLGFRRSRHVVSFENSI